MLTRGEGKIKTVQTDPASLDLEERTNKFYALASAALGILSLCGGFIVPLRYDSWHPWDRVGCAREKV